MVSNAAASYALAFADIAKSNSTLNDTIIDIEKIDEILFNPQMFDFFVNPIVDAERKNTDSRLTITPAIDGKENRRGIGRLRVVKRIGEWR
ncbi:hypothetical protein HN51_033728 [Arachis hypogaea]